MGIFVLCFVVVPLAIALTWITSSASARNRDIPLDSPGELSDFLQDNELRIRFSPTSKARRAALPSTSEACWCPPGQPAMLGDRDVGPGFVYIGQNLPAIDHWVGIEPALLDPNLPRRDDEPDFMGQGMSYEPSYARLTPRSRSGYLAWLAGGRSAPEAPIGFVFLYLYGLERRALADTKRDEAARQELPLIVAEIRRLLGIYQKNSSFDRHASELLAFLELRSNPWKPGTPPPERMGSDSQPMILQAALGEMALAEERLPSDWAFAWATHDPMIYLRTPAHRCREEIEALFELLYREQYGDGFKLRACKRIIAPYYRPISPSFYAQGFRGPEYPDILRLEGPRRKIQLLVNQCCSVLDAYSRWLRRNPDGRGSLLAAAFLPPELLEVCAPAGLVELRQKLEDLLGPQTVALVPVEDVLGSWLGDLSGNKKLTKGQSLQAAAVLSAAGFGFEPDLRFCGQKIEAGQKIALFAIEAAAVGTPSERFSLAALQVQLAIQVAAADGAVGRQPKDFLTQQVVDGSSLDRPEHRRLGAYLEWLASDPPSRLPSKQAIDGLGLAQRSATGELLIALACAQGRVGTPEIKMLTKIYRLLDLDPESVHERLHAHRAPGDLGPVPVLPGDPRGDRGHVLPAPPDPSSAPAAGLVLDPAVIAAKIAESKQTAATLAEIFEDDEPEMPTEPDRPPGQTTSGNSEIFPGLDPAHSKLLRCLVERDAWSRADYEHLAARLGVLPDGAIDLLNDAAFELYEEPLLEGHDPLEINVHVAQEFLA